MLGRQTRYRFSVVIGFLIVAACCGVNIPSACGGVYYDLGQPVIGGWQRHAWVVWDPVLKRDLLWSQESSQDGAVLYALDIDSGDLIEAHDIPAREVSGILTTPESVLYIHTISGLTQPGNELWRFDPKRRKIVQLGLASTPRNRCFGGVIGRDGCVYIGTHDQGRLFRFDPRTDTGHRISLRRCDTHCKMNRLARRSLSANRRGHQTEHSRTLMVAPHAKRSVKYSCGHRGSPDEVVVNDIPSSRFVHFPQSTRGSVPRMSFSGEPDLFHFFTVFNAFSHVDH